MALTNSGFDGTVNEAQYAQMSEIADIDGVADAASWAVSQGTGRQTSVAAGRAFAKGILSVNTAAILTSLGTPVNGQWYLICRHIDWSTNTVTVVALPHSTTSTTVPTAAPTTYPTISNTPGTAYDQKLAWVWVNSVNTSLVFFDLRNLPPKKTYYPVANDAARLALAGLNEGDIVDQADTNVQYRFDGTQLQPGPAKVGGQVVRTNTSVTIPATTWTGLTTAADWTATGGKAALVAAAFNGTWVAPVAGRYRVEACVAVDATVTMFLAIKKNNSAASNAGAVIVGSAQGLSLLTVANLSGTIALAAGDVLRLFIFTSASAPLTANSTIPCSFFGIELVEA